MTETPSPPQAQALPRAQARPARWIGLVWAIPLAALLIVAYLGLRAIANHGVDVVVTFSSAGGARVGDTKVVYKGLEVGRVTHLRLNKDARHVDLTLRLDPNLKNVLRTGTKFWLIGANPSFADLNSLKAAVAGLSIGMAPGPGEPTRRFIGLDEEPAILPGAVGREFVLTTDTLGALRQGSTLLYHGYEAGKVTSVTPVGANLFRAKIFVQAPFDAYVRAGTYFWNASAVRISLTGEGITGQLNSPTTVFSGGVAFETPHADQPGIESPPDTTFILYGDQGRAQQGPDGPEILYRTTFRGSAGELAIGAQVSLDGARVGVVEDVGLVFDPQTGEVSNPVTFGLFPERLHLPGVNPAPGLDWRAVSDGAMRKMLQFGYRVRLDQSPPLIGSRNLNLVKVPGAEEAALGPATPYPLVPAAPAGDASDMVSKADELLGKVNAIPIDAIGRDVRQITGRLRTLVSSPQISDSLAHLDSTLASVDQMVAQVKPQVGPMIGKLNQAADQLQQTAASANNVLSGQGASQDESLPGAIRELTDAARSIRALADYLERHPEAVIKGKPKP